MIINVSDLDLEAKKWPRHQKDIFEKLCKFMLIYANLC